MPTTAQAVPFVFGKLEKRADGFVLTTSDGAIPVEAPFIMDFLTTLALTGQTVSVTGKMETSGSPSITKVIAEKLVSHKAIEFRAYEISQSSRAGPSGDNWRCAEQELLGLHEAT